MEGQAYDGAATMSGIKNGLAIKFIKITKTAVYDHAHNLNHASMQKNDVLDVIDIIENISVFIKRSA
jgi:hypothetical protein